MTAIRKDYWIPRQESLSKRVIKSCYRCKRHQATALAQPPTEILPRDPTEGSLPFQLVVIDHVAPIAYVRRKVKRRNCTYWLELLPILTTEECIRSLKRLIARRG